MAALEKPEYTKIRLPLADLVSETKKPRLASGVVRGTGVQECVGEVPVPVVLAKTS